MEPLKVKRLIIRTETPGSIFESSKELSSIVLNAFPSGGYKDFIPMYDKMIVDAILTKDGDSITIKGKLCKYLLDLRSKKRRYCEKRFFVYDEFDKKGERNTPEKVVEFVKDFSKDRIIPKESDVKLGYENFFKKLLKKKSYYFDASPEIISALRFIDVESIDKDEKGYFYKSWYQSTLMPPTDFEMTTNSYRLTIHK